MNSPAQRRVETLKLTDDEIKNPESCYERIKNVLIEANSKAEAKAKLFMMKQTTEETISDFATRLLDTADYAYEEENHSAKTKYYWMSSYRDC